MNIREEPIITGNIYHVFNKTIDERTLFTDPHYCKIFHSLLVYYRSSKTRVSYSTLRRMKPDLKAQLLYEVSLSTYFLVDILAFNLMPNHYHFLLYQRINGGISRFMSNITNALTRHFNIRSERKGPIFLPKFQAKRIKTDEYLIHVSRYIHLNQYAAGMLSLDKASTYQWSSYREYLTNTTDRLTDDSRVMELFNFSTDKYRRFVDSEAEDQRTRKIASYAYEWEIATGRRRRLRNLEP